MPTAWRLLEDEMEAYLQELRYGNRAEITIKEYRWALRRMFQALLDAKLQTHPRMVGRTEINFVRDDYLVDRSERYKADMVSMMMGFAKWAGNQEMAKIRIGFGSIPTSRVRWLSNEQSVSLKQNAQGIEKMIVHCELDLGMRRTEMLKLKVSDFSSGRINSVKLLGKGRYGGKPRTINWHPNTLAVLEEYLGIRDKEIAKARKKNPGVQAPPNLLIYEANGKLNAYKRSAIENMQNRLGARIGFHFSNHDLRRTCGRMMFRAGVPVEIIARKFGHSDTRTTMHYLGLDFEDLSAAEDLFAKYQASLICPEQGTFEVSQELSGQGGI